MSPRSLPEFFPYPWIPGGHLQTIVSHILPVTPMGADFEPWTIPLVDGDKLLCRFYRGSANSLVLLFHGLGGSADSNYMQITGRAALAKGHSILLINHRGAGEGLFHARGIYHSGVVEDVAAVVAFARRKMPEARLTACGFSLSANLLLNTAGLSTHGLPDEIIAVNPPIDLHLTAKRLHSPRNFVYDQKFVRDLKGLFRKKVAAGMMEAMPQLPRFCRLTDIDTVVTAPVGGFRSRDDYYTRCSSMHYAAKISVPTLILTAEDDPFIPAESFRKAKYSSSVELVIAERGGHVGYLSKRSVENGGVRWLNDFFLAAL